MKTLFKQLTLIVLLVTNYSIYAQKENIEKQNDIQYYQVLVKSLNIRSQPSIKSEITGKLNKQDSIKVIQFVKDWAEVAFINSHKKTQKGYVKSEFISKIEDSKSDVISKKQEKKSFISPLTKKILIGLFIFSFACYIIAMIRVRKKAMVVIVNWYDFALLSFPFASLFICFICSLFNADMYVYIIILSMGALSFTASLIYSIIANKGNLFNIIVAVFAKFFVLMIVGLSLLYIFRGKNKNNTILDDIDHRAKTLAAMGVAGFLIFSLVGDGKNHKEMVEKLKSVI